MTQDADHTAPLFLAGDAQELGDGKRIHIMRVGPIYDPASGDRVGEITAELAREAARGANAFVDAGNAIALSLDHGIERALSDQSVPAERRRSFGTVDGFEFDEDAGEVWAVAHLNRTGLDFVEGHQGDDEGRGNSLRISPCLHMSPLRHTTTGDELAKAWIEVVSLTNAPRQDRMAPVMLARGERAGTPLMLAQDVGPLGAGGAQALRASVESMALEALAAMGIHRPTADDESVRTYAHLLDHTADRALVKVCPYHYVDAPRVFSLPFRRDGERFEADGAPVEGTLRESFEPLSLALSRAADDETPEGSLLLDAAGATIPSKSPTGEPLEEPMTTENLLLARDSEATGLLLSRLDLAADVDEGAVVTTIIARLDEADVLKRAEVDRLRLGRESAADALLDEHNVEGAERAMFRVSLLGGGEGKDLANAALAARSRPDHAAELARVVDEAKARGALPADYTIDEPTMLLARDGGPGLASAVGVIEALPDGAVIRVGPPAGSSLVGSESDSEAAADEKSAAIAELSRLASERATANKLSFGAALSTVKAENINLARVAFGEGVNL